MRKIALLIALAAAPALQAQTRGLQAPPDGLGGPVWQARFERDHHSLMPLAGSAGWLGGAPASHGLRLYGDYQFNTLRLGQTGGLRLTGGLLLQPRPTAHGVAPAHTLTAQPYAGLGYASGSLDGRWDFSADLGLAASTARATLGADPLPRLLPMLRLGMNLAF